MAEAKAKAETPPAEAPAADTPAAEAPATDAAPVNADAPPTPEQEAAAKAAAEAEHEAANAAAEAEAALEVSEYVVEISISGNRDGQPWPAVGKLIELPAYEAADYLRFGYISLPE